MKKQIFFLSLSLLVLGGGLSAYAQLTNGGFENADLTGWTVYKGSVLVYTTFPFGGHEPSEGIYLAGKAQHGGAMSYGMHQTISWAASTAEALVDINTSGGNPLEVWEVSGVRIGIDPNGGTDETSEDIVWSALTSHPLNQDWDVAATAVTGITGGSITIFIEYYSAPYYVEPPDSTPTWSIGVLDNVRVNPLPDEPWAENLDFETATYEHWYSHNSIELVEGNWWPGPYGHAIAPATSGLGGKYPQSGVYMRNFEESYSLDKKCVLYQRFRTDIGHGIPDEIEVRVGYNRDGSSGMDPFNQHINIGIDPTGGVDPTASTVQWSIGLHDGGVGGWVNLSYALDPMGIVSEYSPTATFFLENLACWGLEWNLLAMDNVRLYMDGIPYMGPPVPQPTPPASARPWELYR